MVYPRKDRPYSLIVDACTGNYKNMGGMGAILCQTDKKGNEKVIAYASKKKIHSFISRNGSDDVGHRTL